MENNGYSTGPRVFTKLLKSPWVYLGQNGLTILSYVDDTLLVHTSVDKSLSEVAQTIDLLQSLGFIVHPSKSVIDPTQEIIFLGFVFFSYYDCVIINGEI